MMPLAGPGCRAYDKQALGTRAGVLTACSVPLVYNLQLVRTACGPTIGTSMTTALSDAVKRGPS